MITRSIAWLVPYPLRGSGGHRTIYQNLGALAAAGYDCHVFLERPPVGYDAPYRTAADGKALAEKYFGPIPATFHLDFELDRPYDVAFATAWYTALPLRRANFARRKAYFIQDYEPYFSPMGDDYIIAQNSYRYGFDGISIGRWLSHRLNEEFGMRCSSFDFCADLSVYRPLPDITRERAVCFVYQPEKVRRCPLIGSQALAIVKSQAPDVKIYFYGDDTEPYTYYDVEHLGLVSIERCNELYNRCQVGLCISTTNPSRVPFEMMAAGLPVIDVHGENNLYDMPESAVVLAEPTPESIAHAILNLLDDPEAQRRQSVAGSEFMKSRDLSHGYAQFVSFVERLTRDDIVAEKAAVDPIYTRPPVLAPSDVAADYAAKEEQAASLRHVLAAAIYAGDPFPVSPDGASAPRVKRGTLTARARKRLRRAFRALISDR